MDTANNDDDPFDWTVDQVVTYLCHDSFETWARSGAAPPRPDPKHLEGMLRENDVTGEILLTEVDKSTLVQDLKIKSLGQRATILKAVKYLQRFSEKYREQFGSIPALGPSSVFTPSIPDTQRSLSGNLQPNVSSPAPSQDLTTQVVPPLQTPTRSQPRHEPRSRQKEHYIHGSDGRKRRKLNPEKITTNPSLRSFKPYLSSSKVSISDLFYNDMDDSDDESFFVQSSSAPTGCRRFVNRAVQRYFLQEPRTLQDKDGKEVTAVLPYSSEHLPRGASQYFTLFTKKGNKISVTREDASEWPQLGIMKDNFDYLLTKYPPEDGTNDVLPAYGDSGSEGDYDSDTLRELEEEEEGSSNTRSLPEEMVDNIINDCIASFSSKWRTDKLPLEQSKASKIWTRSRKNKTIHTEIKSSTNRIAHFERRLYQMRKAIKSNPWANREVLKQQCRCMEQTVFDLEEQKWRISVLELDTCPPKQPKPAPIKFRKPRPPYDIDDEESLSSDVGFSEEEDPDFIVPDENMEDTRDMEDKSSVISSNLPIAHSESEDDVVPPEKRRKERSIHNHSLVLQKSIKDSGVHPVPQQFKSSQDSKRNARRPIRADPVEFIDLTGGPSETDPYPEVHTPPLNPINSHDPLTAPELVLDDSGEAQNLDEKRKDSSSSNVPYLSCIDDAHVSFEKFEEKLDRKGLLARLIHCLPNDEKADMYYFIDRVPRKNLKNHIVQALESLRKHRSTVDGFTASDSHLCMRIAVLYISWVHCRKLSERGIPKGLIKSTLNQMGWYIEFHDFICTCFYNNLLKAHKTKSDKLAKSGSADNGHGVSNLSDSEESQELDGEDPADDSVRTPRKKRKRAVKESQEAIHSQKQAQQRVELQEYQRKRLAKKFENMGVSNTDPERQAVSFANPVIYLDPHLGRRVKPHQLSGVQFMWREIINDEKKQGCLLAHTMGLGKTMQV